MSDSTNNSASLQRRRQIAASMGIGITIGILLGIIFSNIALGLSIGIILGGIGALWRAKRAS